MRAHQLLQRLDQHRRLLTGDHAGCGAEQGLQSVGSATPAAEGLRMPEALDDQERDPWIEGERSRLAELAAPKN